METLPANILVSQVPTDSKYNVSFNLNIPLSNQKQLIPLVNFQITIPNTPADEEQIPTQEKIDETMKVRSQNKQSSTNVQSQTDHENHHLNRTITGYAQHHAQKSEKLQYQRHQGHERSRTRDLGTHNSASLSHRSHHPRQTQPVSQRQRDFIEFTESNSRHVKQHFEPLHFSLINQNTYRMIQNKTFKVAPEQNHSLITSKHSCSHRKISFIKFMVEKLNVAVGITTHTRNLAKCQKIKNRYMTYNFKKKTMNIRETIYKNQELEYPNLNVFICAVNFKQNVFCIFNKYEMVRIDAIPEQLLEENIHFFIELWGNGRVTFL